MKICWEILDLLTLTQPKFAAKRYGWKEKQLISDWGIEIDGEYRYIETQWEYIDHCWYCGSDFLKPITTQNHYCDAECRHLHATWKKEWARLKKQRWRLTRIPKPEPIQKPTIGILGQPLGVLKKGTPEWFEMKSLITKETGRRRAAPFIDIKGKARYDTYAHQVDHTIPLAKGGKHHENNLQVLTWKKNNEKADKLDTGIIGIKLDEIKAYYNNL